MRPHLLLSSTFLHLLSTASPFYIPSYSRVYPSSRFRSLNCKTPSIGLTSGARLLLHRSPSIMPGILRVNCLVLGEPEEQIFTIKVAATENISALKDLIKMKRDDLFRDVVAAKITVATAFKQYSEIKHTVPLPKLNPLSSISQTFLNLNPIDVHVIIAPPAGKSPSIRKQSGAGILFLLCTLANITVVQTYIPDWTNPTAILDWIETYKRPDREDQPKVCYFIIHFLQGPSDCPSLSHLLARIFHSCIVSPPSTHYGMEKIGETGSWLDSKNSAMAKVIDPNTQFPC